MSNVKKEKTDCIWCLRGLFDVCLHTPSSDSTSMDSTDSSDSVNLTTYKTNESLKDQQSTGRKRAASLYPLVNGLVRRILVVDKIQFKDVDSDQELLLGCSKAVIMVPIKIHLTMKPVTFTESVIPVTIVGIVPMIKITSPVL